MLTGFGSGVGFAPGFPNGVIDPLEEIAAVSYILPSMLIDFGLGVGFCSRISPWCYRSTRGNSSSKLYIATYVNRLWVRSRVLLQDSPMVS